MVVWHNEVKYVLEILVRSKFINCYWKKLFFMFFMLILIFKIKCNNYRMHLYFQSIFSNITSNHHPHNVWQFYIKIPNGYCDISVLLVYSLETHCDSPSLKICISFDSIDKNCSNLVALLQIGSRLCVLKIKTIGWREFFYRTCYKSPTHVAHRVYAYCNNYS